MDELNDKFVELFNELIKNFSFYIPFQIIEDKVTKEIFSLLNIDLSQEFVDTYVDKLLYIDEDLTIKVVDSFEKIAESNYNKFHKLEYNCFKLINLKETIGKVSYNFLFHKYMENVINYTVICNKLIQYYYIYYPNNAIDPTPIFVQQKNVFEKHLSEIENKINLKGKKITTSDIITNIIETNIFKHYIVEKEIKTPKTNPKINTNREFKDFIIHDNKEEIERIVKTHFSNLRGVSLRYLIEFLKEKGILILKHGDATNLYKTLIKLFEGNDIGAYTSIFDKKVFDKDDENYKSAKITFEKIFEKII